MTLWIMKPTIRNVPSWSSPNANDVPIASPSPRLWTPIPIATRKASASPAVPAPPAGEAAREERHPERAERDAEQDEAGAAERRPAGAPGA